jgi:hypothetical protein
MKVKWILRHHTRGRPTVKVGPESRRLTKGAGIGPRAGDIPRSASQLA